MRQGAAGLGGARRGAAWQGRAWPGKARRFIAMIYRKRWGDNRPQPNYYALGRWATYAGILCLLGWAVTDLLG